MVLVISRAPRSSRLVSAAAIVALVLVAFLSVEAIDSHSLADPLQRDLIRPGSAPLPRTGTLLVQMLSDQNFSSIVSRPLNSSAPLPKWPMNVITINSSIISLEPLSLSTDADGIATAPLLPGEYVLQAPYNTLRIEIPVRIFSGNTTVVRLNVAEGAYSLLYSEAADVGGQPRLYVELNSSSPVANVTEPVTLQVQNGGSGQGYEVFATVVSELPPAQGTQWLELESGVPVDLAGAASVLLATWTYSSSVTVESSG